MAVNTQQAMVEKHIVAQGIHDVSVIAALKQVNRAQFVPSELHSLAYADRALPIGYAQTISQPFIVAYMTEAAMLKPHDKVLEIGTGSGYQAAILSLLCKEVFSIENIKPLGESARIRLQTLGYHNVQVKIGDGYQGWPEQAPFDAIMVTAAPETVPEALIKQLKDGGRMIIPVGSSDQQLQRITRLQDVLKTELLLPVRFVPMIPIAE
jgi:protein-L-isoaspartate(D-aspartate) O-methyltransferase